MKLITRDTDYALRALCSIAQSKAPVTSVSALVQELQIPRPFLRKILQCLNKEGLLVSYKGKGGGFSLSLHPDKIYLLDLISIFQGDLKLNECVFKKQVCPNKARCPLSKKLALIEEQTVSVLKDVTVQSLVNENQRPEYKV
ncbi:MAG: Rrf2 family transcriptional regulator [Candidatus Omnitrophica bacterium]|nr:Rrf2 family transcriptional regulator [Candidatus Omnitrophota bacterium]MDD5671066.1 Rrf2 family transcriptional regulator [Candidatus Omnitrophota bacterium]